MLAASPSQASSAFITQTAPARAASTITIQPVPDSSPGDQVSYGIAFSVKLFAITFAWGSVTFTGTKRDILPLQLKTCLPGDYQFTWDSIVPATASGTATVAINFFAFPFRFARLTTTYTINSGPDSPQTYIGSTRCMSCHAGFSPDVVNAYTQSGHYFALQQANGQTPVYPAFAPGIPGTPPGMNWYSFSYVIGGYGWFANFVLSDNGTVFTGSNGQYNLPSSYLGTSAGYVAYNPGGPAPGQFDCGACHATAYQQNGSWSEPAVGCEACHGPGSLHAYSPYTVKPDSAFATACTDCHKRASTTGVAASDGLIMHEQQAAELQASPKSILQCTSCHSPHASAHYDDQAAGTAMVTACTTCHDTITVNLNMSQLECIDCHMPYAVQAGTSATFLDADLKEMVFGDMRSHIFKINVDAAGPADMFSDNGTQLVVDTSGKSAGLTLNFVCLGCHRVGGQAATTYTYDQVKAFAPSVHAQ